MPTPKKKEKSNSIPSQTKAEIKEIIDTIPEDFNSEINKKYEKFTKTISLANYALFLAIVWKSFELGGKIPCSAKWALWMFGLGILFSAFRALADYFAESVEFTEHYEKLMYLEEKYSDDLKHILTKNELKKLEALNSFMRWTYKKVGITEFDGFLAQLAYFLVSFASLVISCILLLIGLTLLGVAAT